MSEIAQEFSGRIAFITGGARGIGLAVSHALAEQGADLILGYKKDETNAEQAAAALHEQYGCQVWTVAGDLRDPKSITAMFKQIAEEAGKLDILVLSAAFGTMGRIERMGLYSWDATYEINVRSVMLCARAAHPMLKESGGCIVALSSIGAFVAFQEYAAVGSSKAALESLVRYLANEFTPDGIAVNAVSAGPVDTRAIQWFRKPEAVHRFAECKTTQGRIGQPEDISSVVAFLCSDKARWIVGQTIVADGGITLGINFEDWLRDTGQDEGL
ncbi:MAG: SDR family oxidoreductase [Myxococcota bacterium]|nr:SDR family oxidoreductase [Myxococcota bacterium]